VSRGTQTVGQAAAWREAARGQGERGVADDLGVLDRRLAALQQSAKVHGRQEPSGELGELEEGAVARWIPGRACRLDAGRRGQRAHTPTEVQPHIGLWLAPPSEGARPPVGVEQERESEDRSEAAGYGGGEATRWAEVRHAAILCSAVVLRGSEAEHLNGISDMMAA
jgi:hypothetical protein